MENIFISAVNNFEKNLSIKDFLEAWENYFYIYEKGELMWFNDRKHKKSLKNILSNLDNKEYIKILDHVCTPSPEESEFYNWIILINEFYDFIENYTDPLFYDTSKCSVGLINKNKLFTYKTDEFKFSILFEKSNIKKTESYSLFDSITGLNKEKNLLFITITIENLISKKTYNYEYIEDGSITNKTGIDDDICDKQLEIVKNSLNRYIISCIENIFDTILTNKAKESKYISVPENYKFSLFKDSYYEKTKGIYGDIWKEWIGKIYVDIENIKETED